MIAAESENLFKTYTDVSYFPLKTEIKMGSYRTYENMKRQHSGQLPVHSVIRRKQSGQPAYSFRNKTKAKWTAT